MNRQELARLEKLEQFVQRLTLGTYLAKAASEGGRVLGDRRLLEQGEQVLAKAATAYLNADALMKMGEQHISDPTAMGAFEGHLSAGDLNAARDMLVDVKERNRVAKAVDAADQVDTLLGDEDLDAYDARAAASELTAKFAALERTLAALETRLAQIESRPVAAPAPVPATVAKSAGAGSASKKARSVMTPKQEAQSLMADVERYIDDPATTGALSSLIQAGKLEQVRPAVERARQAHETERIRAERRGFKR